MFLSLEEQVDDVALEADVDAVQQGLVTEELVERLVNLQREGREVKKAPEKEQKW